MQSKTAPDWFVVIFFSLCELSFMIFAVRAPQIMSVATPVSKFYKVSGSNNITRIHGNSNRSKGDGKCLRESSTLDVHYTINL